MTIPGFDIDTPDFWHEIERDQLRAYVEHVIREHPGIEPFLMKIVHLSISYGQWMEQECRRKARELPKPVMIRECDVR
jgi:hypothetical protein